MGDPKFSIPLLNGQNWQTWRIRIEMLLCRENLWEVISNGLPVEEERTTAWLRNDRKAKAALILLIDDSQLPLVKDCVYAHDVYSALKNYHQKTTRSVRVSLLKRLCSTNLAENGDVEKHLAVFDDLFDRLDGAGMNLDKDTKVCMLLRSLPPSYDGLVTALDSRSDEDISLDVVKAKLVDEFNRHLERKGVAVKVEKAMRSEAGKPRNETRTCHYCKKAGHLKRNCRKLLADQQRKDCNSPKVEPDRNVKAKAAHNDARGVAFTVADEAHGSWVIDSGASAHMCNDESFFRSLKHFAGGFITLADGKRTQIQGEGSGVVYGVNGEGHVQKIDVNEVKFVPAHSTNLISVSKLSQKGFKVSFDTDGCDIVDVGGTIVATGGRHGGLCYLRIAETSMAATEGHHKVNCQHQWHRRLGHRDWAAAERIVEDLATGMKVSDCGLRQVCKCCMESKSARLPFPPVVNRKASRALDIVHTDLCGPMECTTPSGNRYAMTITDDFSRFTVTYLLRHKSEAANTIKEYVKWVKNLFGRKPRVVRSDGGGEFVNKELRDFYKAEGIQQQFTTPYSPQQNGVAERKNRSLGEMATGMLVDAGLEKRFWGEAILTATYLQNRLPSRSVPRTPYELWWGKKPDLGHLRVFGSQAYVHVPDTKRKKMDSKATKLTFIGYAIEQKGYRFVDLESNLITVSRDARFIELGNGSSSVEIPDPATKKISEEDVQVIPSKEEEGEDHGEEASGLDDIELDSENENAPSSGIRRSKRTTQGTRPRYLQEYDLEFAVGFAACAVEGPADHREAMQDPIWRKAMDEEIAAHQRNGTWKLVPRPKDQKVIGSKWIYKVKRNENNQIVKCKARLVAQGYTQRTGVDVHDVFAPVTCQATFRAILTVASNDNMSVRHLDIKTAYLYGYLEESVFMRQPPGFEAAGKENNVCQLQRSIYGLRQSARCWNKRLDDVLLKNGFRAAAADPCLYVKGEGKTKVLLMVYVDDLLVASTDEEELVKICGRLQVDFDLTCLGEVRHFLGVEVQHVGGVYKLSLRNYIEKLISMFGMEECKTAKSPMDAGYLKLAVAGEAFKDPTTYRSLVGGLLYLAVVARPDIAATAAILGRKFSDPREHDWTAAKRVLRYLKATKSHQLQLGGDKTQSLVGYSDADWAEDVGSRRSTTGIVFQFGGFGIRRRYNSLGKPPPTQRHAVIDGGRVPGPERGVPGSSVAPSAAPCFGRSTESSYSSEGGQSGVLVLCAIREKESTKQAYRHTSSVCAGIG